MHSVITNLRKLCSSSRLRARLKKLNRNYVVHLMRDVHADRHQTLASKKLQKHHVKASFDYMMNYKYGEQQEAQSDYFSKKSSSIGSVHSVRLPKC